MVKTTDEIFGTGKNVQKLKGKFVPIIGKNGVEKIKNIFTMESSKRNLPVILFQGEFVQYLGITIARQSSDFLVHLAHQMLLIKKETESSSNIRIIQYQFPHDYQSLKLILIKEWSSPDEFESIKEIFDELQGLFRKKLKEISTQFWK